MFSVLVAWGRHYKIPQTGELNQLEFVSHSSRGWTSKITVLADLVSGESSLPGP